MPVRRPAAPLHTGQKVQSSDVTVTKPAKYRAVPTTVDGIRFASKKESRRYRELVCLVLAGEVRDFVLQPRFPLLVHGVDCGTYIADFRYRTRTGEVVVEDCKGVRTPVYRLKRKLVKAIYSVEIREV